MTQTTKMVALYYLKPDVDYNIQDYYDYKCKRDWFIMATNMPVIEMSSDDLVLLADELIDISNGKSWQKSLSRGVQCGDLIKYESKYWTFVSGKDKSQFTVNDLPCINLSAYDEYALALLPEGLIKED